MLRNWKLPVSALMAIVVAALVWVPSGAVADHVDQHGLELPDLVQVTSGWMHSCGLSGGGEVYCWGNNATGNLGDGTAANTRPIAKRVQGFDAPVREVSAGADHTCAVTDLGDGSGDLWCWGGNLAGQLGGLSSDVGLVKRFPGKLTQDRNGLPLPRFVSVSAGNSHSCALDVSGRPWCWGSNTYGQLGDCWTTDGDYDACNVTSGGAPRPVNVSQMGTAVKVLAGAVHSCAVDLDAQLWCWGDNVDGQLGIGTRGGHADHPAPVHTTAGFPEGGVTDLALGTYHTCAVTLQANVYCWGDNTHGRIGSASASAIPTAQGPDSLVPQKVTRYEATPFTGLSGVSAGLDHTCAWNAGGAAWCWGRAAYGHLGDGIVATSQPRPRHQVRHTTLLAQDTGAIVSIANGYNHTCSLNHGGKAHCWGHNGFGQNGDGTFVFHKEPARVLQLHEPL